MATVVWTDWATNRVVIEDIWDMRRSPQNLVERFH